MWSVKNYTNELTYKREIDTHIENKFKVTKEEINGDG